MIKILFSSNVSKLDTFQDAPSRMQLSPNSSFVWRSIMSTMLILRSRSCWQVGNGESIKVLLDKWISNYPTNKVLHPVHEDEEDWRVSDLMDSELHRWRQDIIMERFNREDVEAICKIPLSHRRETNAVVWLHNKDGKYSVRSDYHVARKVLKEWAECSIDSGQHIWKKLWKVQVPNKMKVFASRACHEILPTQVNLVKRNIIKDNTCLLSKSSRICDSRHLGVSSIPRCLGW